MANLTFRSSRIVYYGPHACPNCAVSICKMGIEFGGNAFDYPSGPIYPNTEWHPHVCDPKRVAALLKADVPAIHPDDTLLSTDIAINFVCAKCRQKVGDPHSENCMLFGHVVDRKSGYLDEMNVSPYRVDVS